MAQLFTLGISKIEVGAIAGDGGMGATLATIGNTFEGSASLNSADANVTEFYCEEFDTPELVYRKAGLDVFTFRLSGPDLTQIVAVMGGSIVGTGVSATWQKPIAVPIIEKSVKITPMSGLIFNIPRASIYGKFVEGFAKNKTLLLEVTITALQPTKAATGPYQVALQ